MSYSETLYSPQQAREVLSDVWPKMKSALMGGQKLVLTVKKEKRSLDQNAKFHAMCDDLAKAGIQWAGKPRTADQWKILLVSGHATATKQGAEIVPGIEGEFVNLRESTANMSKERSSSLIEYTLAFAAMHGLELKDA